MVVLQTGEMDGWWVTRTGLAGPGLLTGGWCLAAGQAVSRRAQGIRRAAAPG